jgi:tetraacyldisaccharide 4'-kinase
MLDFGMLPDPPVILRPGRGVEEFPGSRWRWLALPAWLLWRPVVRVRDASFDLGLRKPAKLAAPVISVGNLAVGGTGKTPVVRLLAGMCRELGRNPAVLSRGFRAGADGRNDEAGLFGDVPVVCDVSRKRGGLAALAAGADCLILDDGFQHRQVYRDLDIVLIDATRALGMTLPVGWLREGPSALRRAGLIWVTRSELVAPEESAGLLKRLREFGVPVVVDRMEAATLAPLNADRGQDQLGQPVSVLAGVPIILASGLGNPLGFERTAVRAGLVVRSAWRFPDHHHYSAEDVEALRAAAKEADAAVVVTAKDAVKLAGILGEFSGRGIWVLRAGHGLDAQARADVRGMVAKTLGR